MLIHSVVTFLAIACVVLTVALQIAAVMSPNIRERLSWYLPAFAFGTVILGWIARTTGQWAREIATEAEAHTSLESGLAYLMTGFFVLILLFWLITSPLTERYLDEDAQALRSNMVVVILGVVSVLVGLGAAYMAVVTAISLAITTG